MGAHLPKDPERFLRDLIDDPMIRLIMIADGIDDREVFDLFDRTAAEVRKRGPAAVAPDPASDRLRRGVGIMLIDRSRRVFVGQRMDTSEDAWQMPQGGIEDGESPEGAALRELREELGTSNVEVIVETQGWLSYQLPDALLALTPTCRWRGQTQKWFLMRFLGTDDEIDVATEHPEFSRWRWAETGELLELIVPFKRDLYRQVVQEFSSRLDDDPAR